MPKYNDKTTANIVFHSILRCYYRMMSDNWNKISSLKKTQILFYKISYKYHGRFSMQVSVLVKIYFFSLLRALRFDMSFRDFTSVSMVGSSWIDINVLTSRSKHFKMCIKGILISKTYSNERLDNSLDAPTRMMCKILKILLSLFLQKFRNKIFDVNTAHDIF